MAKTTTFRSLAKKGDGVLVRRGSVWTYPSAESDRSGTNLQLPVEYVSDAEVQQALRDGDLLPAVSDAAGAVMSVRVKADGDEVQSISVVQAGTPEAGTDLPNNSRPSHDAGMKRPGIESPEAPEPVADPKTGTGAGGAAPITGSTTGTGGAGGSNSGNQA